MTAEDTITDRFAVFIREKRKALGMNQREFAKHVFGHEKHQGWICKIENKHMGTTLTTIGRVLDKLNSELVIHER